MTRLRYLKDVATLKLDEEKCIGCGACVLNCPTEALTVNAGVGCSAAVINSLLGGGSATGCSCSIEPDETCSSNKRPTCC